MTGIYHVRMGTAWVCLWSLDTRLQLIEEYGESAWIEGEKWQSLFSAVIKPRNSHCESAGLNEQNLVWLGRWE